MIFSKMRKPDEEEVKNEATGSATNSGVRFLFSHYCGRNYFYQLPFFLHPTKTPCNISSVLLVIFPIGMVDFMLWTGFSGVVIH